VLDDVLEKMFRFESVALSLITVGAYGWQLWRDCDVRLRVCQRNAGTSRIPFTINIHRRESENIYMRSHYTQNVPCYIYYACAWAKEDYNKPCTSSASILCIFVIVAIFCTH
jgi:hypothetical protein